MRRRFVLLVALVITVIAFLFREAIQERFRSHRSEHRTELDSSPSAPPSEDRKKTESRSEFQQRVGNSANTRQKAEVLRSNARERVNNEWRAPMHFYGKVVEEGGKPVEEVRVVFGINNLSGHHQRTTTSDASGLFYLVGEQGKHLSIQLSKSGYYTSTKNPTGFFYAGENNNFSPDASNPIVFHLRKKQAAEPLITVEFPGFAKIEKLPPDGQPIELDLIKGAKALQGTGHLKFEFWRNPATRDTRAFDWRYRISVPNGGILKTEEEFNFEAPEEGYLALIEEEMPASRDDWQTRVRRKYFIQLPNGNYGRVDFYLLAKSGVFEVHSAINPSGSRNLEFDPEVQAKQTVFE